jgi:peptidase A4-like protein
LSEITATVPAVLKALLALALVATAAAAGRATAGASPTFAARVAAAPEVSSNWSGYALIPPSTDPLSFSDVTGTWVQPKATCTSGRQDAAAFWVGLGGYDESSTSLEQLGSAIECNGSSKTPVNYVWWELVPAPARRLTMKVSPGDTITAAVLVQDQTITFSLRDVTRGTRFSKVLTTNQGLDTASAEWIAEAPSNCSFGGRCSVVPLTNFRTVTFSKAAAIGNTHPGTILDPTWTADPIELIADNSQSGLLSQSDVLGPGVGAVPADVTSDGRSFSVSWQRNLTPPTG